MPKEKKTKAKKDLSTLRAANKPEYVTGTGQELWRVHLKQDCAHRICDIHNPPQGLPESDWPTHWRADRGLMERICPHGVGHPTAAHMLFLKEMDAVRGTENFKWEGIHGCDGCCASEEKRAWFEDNVLRADEYDDEPYGVDDDEADPFVLDPEFEPYFDDTPLLPNNGASDWEMGRRSLEDWSGLFEKLFEPNRTRNPDLLDFFFSKEELAPEWVDHAAPGNGIGPVCRYCHVLVDWDPVDHKLDCNRFGTDNGL